MARACASLVGVTRRGCRRGRAAERPRGRADHAALSAPVARSVGPGADPDDARDPRVIRVVRLAVDDLARLVADGPRDPHLLAVGRGLDPLARALRQRRRVLDAVAGDPDVLHDRLAERDLATRRDAVDVEPDP